MTYNPRIKNSDNGTVRVSGSIAVNKTGTNISCSNLTVDNSLTFSNATGSTGKLSISSFSGIKTPIRKVSDNTDISTDDYVVLVDASNKYTELIVPSSSQAPGQHLVVKKTDSTINIVRISSKKVDDSHRQSSILSGTLAIDVDDLFGQSVSINATGDRIAVGAIADEEIGGANAMGALYLFSKNSTTWTQTDVIFGTKATASLDNFGASVAMNYAGDIILVGAPQDEMFATPDTGIVYIFTSESSGWNERHVVTPVNMSGLSSSTGDNFGKSVAINAVGDILAVGAPDGELIGGSASMGLVYIWKKQREQLDATFVTALSGSLAVQGSDNFGYSVSINAAGDRLVVGARLDEKNTVTASTGLAYVFTSGSSGWTESSILSGSLAVQTNDYFGNSVSINAVGDCVVAGAYQDEKNTATGSTGLAYVFQQETTEKIDNATNKILYTKNESVRLVSDGSGSWNII